MQTLGTGEEAYKPTDRSVQRWTSGIFESTRRAIQSVVVDRDLDHRRKQIGTHESDTTYHLATVRRIIFREVRIEANGPIVHVRNDNPRCIGAVSHDL